MATQSANTKQKNGILLIGLVCEDIICTVPAYPKEDDKIRCSSSVLKRGGNAANSAVVLSLLNSLNKDTSATDLYFMASLSNKQRSQFVVSDLNRYGIDTELCVYHKDHDMTVSYIIVSAQTKSRTIINHPCLKPLSFDDFMETMYGHTNTMDDSNVLQTIDNTLQFVTEYDLFGGNTCVLDGLQMIHVETRWISSMLSVLGYVKKHHPNIFISIEIEKERLYNDDDGRSLVQNHGANKPVNDLIPFADLVFFSRQIVKQRGYAQKEDNPHEFIKDMIREYGENRAHHPLTIVVPWGEQGAYGIKYDCSLALYDEDYHHDIDIQFSKAYSPKKVLDTIGAGDTYIGAYLHYAVAHDIWEYDVNHALDFACQVAGFKVGCNGFDCIQQFKSQ